MPEPVSLIWDSAKLARLDALLDELKPAGHRVLIYFQMARMIDLMEEYMTFRKHKYFRYASTDPRSSKIGGIWWLTGKGSKCSRSFRPLRMSLLQAVSTPDIFVFLLSTRAGDLGINLTAAPLPIRKFSTIVIGILRRNNKLWIVLVVWVRCVRL